jgi:hypothetical protein
MACEAWADQWSHCGIWSPSDGGGQSCCLARVGIACSSPGRTRATSRQRIIREATSPSPTASYAYGAKLRIIIIRTSVAPASLNFFKGLAVLPKRCAGRIYKAGYSQPMRVQSGNYRNLESICCCFPQSSGPDPPAALHALCHLDMDTRQRLVSRGRQ